MGGVIPLDHCALLMHRSVARVHMPAFDYFWHLQVHGNFGGYFLLTWVLDCKRGSCTYLQRLAILALGDMKFVTGRHTLARVNAINDSLKKKIRYRKSACGKWVRQVRASHK